MGLLADIFDIEPDTEQDIKDVLKTVGIIATILIAGGDASPKPILPFSRVHSA